MHTFAGTAPARSHHAARSRLDPRQPSLLLLLLSSRGHGAPSPHTSTTTGPLEMPLPRVRIWRLLGGDNRARKLQWTELLFATRQDCTGVCSAATTMSRNHHQTHRYVTHCAANAAPEQKLSSRSPGHVFGATGGRMERGQSTGAARCGDKAYHVTTRRARKAQKHNLAPHHPASMSEQ